MFNFVGVTCICVSQGGLRCDAVSEVFLHIGKYWIFVAILGDKYIFFMRWGMPLFGFPLIGSVYYGFYMQYMCYAAFVICIILLELLKYAYLQSNFQGFKSENLFYFESLPKCIQTFAFHLTLTRIKSSKNPSLAVFMLLLFPDTVAGLSRADCDFIQDCLLYYPSFKLLAQLCTSHHHYFIRTSFLLQLRGIRRLPTSREGMQLALMRELLEGAEAKLMLLWLIGMRRVAGAGRLPGVLIQEIVAYI